MQKFIEQVHEKASFLASQSQATVFVRGHAPLRKKEPLETGVDTHTVPLGGARVEGLNRYLKSLRNKRKKHRKSSAKRARENDRCRKMKKEYLALDWGRESLKNNLKSVRESPRNNQKSGGQGGDVCGMCVSVSVCVYDYLAL